MSGYNTSKQRVLAALELETWMPSSQVALRLQNDEGSKLSVRAVRMALLRYHRQGLVQRRWGDGEYVYALSQRGYDRLRWIQSVLLEQTRPTKSQRSI